MSNFYLLCSLRHSAVIKLRIWSFLSFNMAATVHGSFAEGYEPIRIYFEKMLKSGCEDRLQLCIYVNNVCVVDLYGSQSNDDKYDGDSIQVKYTVDYFVFSSA